MGVPQSAEREARFKNVCNKIIKKTSLIWKKNLEAKYRKGIELPIWLTKKDLSMTHENQPLISWIQGKDL